MGSLRGCVFFLAILPLLPPASGQTQTPGDLADATLEQLMNLQVTSVSKSGQSLGKTAASVYVITAEDIRRSGMTSLPEVLRLAPGVQVARTNSGTWAISIRGFNNEFANKVLVLVDGRSAYSELFSGVFWDTQQMPLDNIERIEVIRGPGAVMWGVDAVNGVINIITKSAKETQGGLVTTEGGSANQTSSSVRYGGQLGSSAYYRVDAREDSQAAFNTAAGKQADPNGWNNLGADFRVDWDPTAQDSLLFSGDAYHSTVGHEFPTLAGNPFPVQADGAITNTGGNFLARWQHEFSNGSTISLQASWNSNSSADVEHPVHENVLSVNFQQHVALGGRQEIIWGLDYREAFYRPGEVAPLSATPVLNSAVPLSPANEALYDVFAEDQITLIPDKLQLIAGAHVSHNEFTGFDVQPTGRLLWTPNDKATTWLAISRAVRTPTLVEQYYDAIVAEEAIAPPLFAVVHLLGDPNFVSEIMVAYEAGQRVQIGRRISLDGSLFYNVYQHLSSVTAEAPVLMPGVGALPPYLEIPTLFGNYRYGESYGGEVSATWSVNSRWSLTAGANAILIHTRPYPGNVNTDSFLAEDSTPKHQFQVHSYFNLTRTIQIDTGIYYYSAMPVLGVPQYLRGDLRLGWRPTEKLEFSVGVQDAFEANHVEFLSSQFPQLEEVPRNFYGKVTWRF